MPMPATAHDVAQRVGGQVRGDATIAVTGLTSVDEAEPGALVFAENARYIEQALRSQAAVILVPAEAAPLLPTSPKTLILVVSPRMAFLQMLEAWDTPIAVPVGLHATAVLGVNVERGDDVRIGAHCVIDDDVVLEDGVVVLPGAKIGAGCHIGAGTVVHCNAVLYSGVHVGKRCILLAGCVIGADGFGFVPVGANLRKVPHRGRVEIGDDVEIGANSCIDRARTGATVIGAGTKIDNLVHIAHNVQIGQSSIFAAQAGVAGSTRIGNGVILGGQAGIKDHATIGDGARVGAQGGVIGDVAPGETVSGYPARPHRVKMREYAALSHLPQTTKRVRELEARLAALETLLESKGTA